LLSEVTAAPLTSDDDDDDDDDDDLTADFALDFDDLGVP
jgi:hypothetical protein